MYANMQPTQRACTNGQRIATWSALARQAGSAAAMLHGSSAALSPLACSRGGSGRSECARPPPHPHEPPPMPHPCLSCGACCAHFRISLHWSEAEPSLGGRACGTDRALRRQRDAPVPRRCDASRQGQVGVDAPCAIYADRPQVLRPRRSTVRPARGATGRAAHGLRPLAPPDWPGHARA